MRVFREVFIPQVVIEMFRVIQTPQPAPTLEMLDALAPVLPAPVVGIQPTG